ncbi:DUF1611 domain-containing protein [uncultured Ruegeria sp.]|uniref:DUF1611 domain-containing protein n=1 Tax=uncultured Ruegeria sp. TaxID=259304 RepID=UPI00262B5D59|nr:DUF1611 domain-containing protein [uncultured Ruegeria sp.]
MKPVPFASDAGQSIASDAQKLPPEQAVIPELHCKTLVTDTPTAIVYCEGNFTKIDCKTANGLVRHSHVFRVLSVIDSTNGGCDSGKVPDNVANQVPIFDDLDAAVANEATIPDTFIYGMAPASGRLSLEDREVVVDAITLGMNIVSGLHEFLSEDKELAGFAKIHDVTIRDIRKPRPNRDLRLLDGSVGDVHGNLLSVD